MNVKRKAGNPLMTVVFGLIISSEVAIEASAIVIGINLGVIWKIALIQF